MSEIAVTPELVAEHDLTPEEYARLREILGREPNYTELGIFSVMWSEHCSYKSSRVHLKRLPTEGPQVLQGPGENAGVVDLGDGLAGVFKIESHNHPSFVEPFQGAATGVGGILRDIFTMGARPLAVMDALHFGMPDDKETGARNRAVAEGIVAGVGFYGNCIGVPNIGGEVNFEPCYAANPLVNALCFGVAPKEKIFLAKAAGLGNPVIYVGAKTGRDGIHGASLLASAEFDETSMEKRPNVQIGDPFLEKLLLEAILEVLETGAVVGLQDMGAAGLTCSTTEMAASGNVGVEIELDHVPQRATGMTPYEIMLSESQERMLLVAEKGREAQVLGIFSKWGLDAVVIGAVTDDGLLRVRHHGEVVAEIPARPLTNDCPLYDRPLTVPAKPEGKLVEFASNDAAGKNLRENFLQFLASPNIASRRWVFEQYDSTVRTNTVRGPGHGDAGVLRLKGTKRGVALTVDGNGRYCRLDPHRGAQLAVAEAARNLVAVGAKPLAATNCLNFGNPEKPEIMGQFSAVIDGMAEACKVFGTPITGGNVSFYNETKGKGIYPTPVIGMLGVLEEVERALGMGFRAEGSAIVQLGGRQEPEGGPTVEFSSSEYARVVYGVTGGEPPAIDLAYEKKVHDCFLAAHAQGMFLGAHDISDGGLLVALAECCFAAPDAVDEPCGIDITLESKLPLEAALFHEAPSRFIVEIAGGRVADLLRLAGEYGVEGRQLGRVTGGSLQVQFKVQFNQQVVLESDVAALREAWQNGLPQLLQAVTK